MQFWAPAPDPLAAIIEPNSVSDPPAASTPSPVPPAELPATVTFASTAGSEARIPPPPPGGPAAPLGPPAVAGVAFGSPSPPPPPGPATFPLIVEPDTVTTPPSL